MPGFGAARRGFRLGRRLLLASVLISPTTLFSGGETGAFYDPSDLSTLFQDTAGTTPAVVGQPVGLMRDKSGRANHMTQATTSKKPTLRQDAGGKHYLEFDGVDDWMVSTFAVAPGLLQDRFIAFKPKAHGGGRYILDGKTADRHVLYQTGSAPQLTIYLLTGLPFTGPATGAAGVVTQRFRNGNGTAATLDNNAYTAANIGSSSCDGMTIAAAGNDSYGAGTRSQIDFYGALSIARALTDSEVATVRKYLAANYGGSL